MFEDIEPKLKWQSDVFQKEKSTWEKIFGGVNAWDIDTFLDKPSAKTFEKALEAKLEPNLSLQELSVRIVESALELEFGARAQYGLDYAEMIGVIADALRKAPDMREQMLAVSNMILRKKLQQRKKIVH